MKTQIIKCSFQTCYFLVMKYTLKHFRTLGSMNMLSIYSIFVLPVIRTYSVYKTRFFIMETYCTKLVVLYMYLRSNFRVGHLKKYYKPTTYNFTKNQTPRTSLYYQLEGTCCS